MKRNRRLSILLGVVTLATLPLLAVDWLGSEVHSTEPVASGGARLVAAPGWVEPASEERKLSAEVRGNVKSIHVEEGDAIHAGQILATIADADYLAGVQQAKALVRQRAAELEKLINGARTEERLKARAELREAEAVLTNARKVLERRRFLAKEGHASRERLDDAEADVRTAEARVEARAEALALVEAAPRAEDVDIARALLESARGRLAEAEAWFERTRIVSPIDGTVLHRALNEGEGVTIDPPTLVFIIGDLSRLRVRADVDETDVSGVAVGMRAHVTADAYPGERFSGTVVRVGTQMGNKTLRTDEPTERLDTKVLETLIELDPGTMLPVGLRVDTFIEADGSPKS